MLDPGFVSMTMPLLGPQLVLLAKIARFVPPPKVPFTVLVYCVLFATVVYGLVVHVVFEK